MGNKVYVGNIDIINQEGLYTQNDLRYLHKLKQTFKELLDKNNSELTISCIYHYKGIDFDIINKINLGYNKTLYTFNISNIKYSVRICIKSCCS